MNFNLFIGERISEIRKQRNISQENLATLAEIDRTYISSIERGQRSISLSVAIKITTALGLDLNTLIKKNDGTCIDGFDLSAGDRISKE